MIDGVNGLPLVADQGGGKENNVEPILSSSIAPMQSVYGVIGEVKHDANNVWYAVVQNLLQVKLTQRISRVCGLLPTSNRLRWQSRVTGAIVAHVRSFCMRTALDG